MLLGDVVLRQTKNGKTIICKKPDFSNRQFSQGQLDHQGRVKLAAAYGVENKENPIYMQKPIGTDKNAYSIAFQDWFYPPVQGGLRYANERVRVDVTDDVMVSRVPIMILDSQGNVLEQNDAGLGNGITWEYRPVNKGRTRSRPGTCPRT